MPVATACMLVNKAKQDKLAARQAKAAQTAGSGAAADSMEASFIQGDKWQPLLDSHLPGTPKSGAPSMCVRGHVSAHAQAQHAVSHVPGLSVKRLFSIGCPS